MAAPRSGAESVLGLRPFRWLGRLSYSLYLWHWPILIIAADQAGKTSLPFRRNVVWLLLALALSVVTYTLVENPIRHARVLSRGLAPIALGAVLIAATLVLCTVALNSEQSNVARRVPPVSASALSSLLRRAPEMQTLPTDLTPSLAEAHQDWGGPPSACSPGTDQTSIPNTCIFGDSSASRTMVMYGDSHAGMWFDALNVIAKEAHWRLVDLWKGGCPVDSLTYRVPPGSGKPVLLGLRASNGNDGLSVESTVSIPISSFSPRSSGSTKTQNRSPFNSGDKG